MRFDSLEGWLAWQETCHPREIDLGLARIHEVAQRLDLLHPEATVITVSGTNGKGSCVATLEALLLAQGETAGAYTSPHLQRYNERIRVDGLPATDADICAAFAAIDEARGDISLSYFEFGTLAAFWLFRKAGVRFWLLEVGLGGRLDATNIIDTQVAVVTSIAIDHEQWLGSDRETIGREKAGIFRHGRPVICADRNVPNSVINRAEDLQCPLYLVGREFDWQLQPEGDRCTFTLMSKGESQTLDLPKPRLPAASVAAAIQVLELLEQLPSSSVTGEALAALSLPGRFQQIIVAQKPVYLDVAHNPAAADHLAVNLQQAGVADMAAIVAMMADKDIRASLGPLIPYVRHWWLASLPDVPRAAPPETLQTVLLDLGVAQEQITLGSTVAETVQQVLLDRDQASSATLASGCRAVLITGSFFTVSAALDSLGEVTKT